MKKLRSNGFTIIELLIATVVFSIVLLTISAAIIQIGRIYFKGVTSARTQEAARSVMGDIVQAIQLSPGQVTPVSAQTDNPGDHATHSICVDTLQYSFKLGQKRVDNNYSLVANNVPSGCSGVPAQDLTNIALNGNQASDTKGAELLGENMRLANLSVEQQLPDHPNMYKVTVRVVYGDDDLLCSPNGDVSKCTSNSQMTAAEIAAARDLKCKDVRVGTQFCAASELSTMVERRLE